MDLHYRDEAYAAARRGAPRILRFALTDECTGCGMSASRDRTIQHVTGCPLMRPEEQEFPNL